MAPKRTILIVDDNDDMASMLRTLLGGQPDLACVGTLPRADTLLEAIDRDRPDIVLLDLTMPGRNPLDAMHDALQRPAPPRFVILSGYDDPALIDDCLERGATAFASKLGDLDAIVNAVRTA